MLKVSVIIPVYNVEAYLETCLDSVFCQTLKELEVICVNDGSTDNSLNILNKYKKQYNNIIVVTKENAGQGIARNIGINLAKGDFLMFIDPDDYLPSDDVLETLYAKAKMNNVEVCGGNITVTTSGNGLEFFDVMYKKYKIEAERMYRFKDYQYVGSHQRYIYKTNFLSENNFFYPNYRRGEDFVFLANVLNYVDKFYMIDKNVYSYRRSHKEECFTLQKADDLVMSYYNVLNLSIDNRLKELFDGFIDRMNSFAKRYWYRLLDINHVWDRVNIVNEIITKGNLIFEYDRSSNCLMDKYKYRCFIESVKEDWKKSKFILDNSKKIAIYGTGEVGRRTKRYLSANGYKVNYFVVSSKKSNETEIDGIPVLPVDEVDAGEQCLFILSALNERVKKNMEEQLLHKGINNILNFNCDIVGCFGD